jgi:hypothetical protein
MKNKISYPFRIDVQPGIPSANGNLYPLSVLKEAVKKYQDKIYTSCSFVRVNREKFPSEASFIDAGSVVCLITELKVKEKKFYGKLVFMKTDVGRELKRLVDSGKWQFKVELCGKGHVQLDAYRGCRVIQPGYELMGFLLKLSCGDQDV